MKKRVAVITPLDRSEEFDLGSQYMYMPRYGSLTIATVIRNASYDCRLFCEMSGSTIDWDYVASCDYVLFSLLATNSLKSYELTEKVRGLTDAPIIFGGCHVTVLPEDCLEYCDYAVRKEGDETVVALLLALDNGDDVSTVAGISYKKDGIVRTNPDRPFIEDLDWKVDIRLIHQYKPVPLGKMVMDIVRLRMPRHHLPVVQTTRGCPFPCDFCFAQRELGKKYRRRKIQYILEEIEDIIDILKVRLIQIVDNEFCANEEHSLEVLEAIYQRFGGTIKLIIFTRVGSAYDPVFLKKLKKLGVFMLMVGLESINDATLQAFNKKQTSSDILKAIDCIAEADIILMAFFIVGTDTDHRQSVEKSVDFAIEHGISEICLFSLFDFPFQAKLRQEHQFIPDHYFIHHDWRFFSSNYVIHYPKYIKPSVLQRGIMEGYHRFYSIKRGLKDIFLRGDPRLLLRRWGNLEFLASMERYIPYLEKVEKGLYDGNDRLLEEKLLQIQTPKEKQLTLR